MARKVLQARNHLDAQLSGFADLQTRLRDAQGLIELAELEGDDEVVATAEQDLIQLQALAAKREMESLLSGEADANDCYLSINAGAGGTEACDWAAMLYRLYERWAAHRAFKVQILDEHEGEEAGIKSATLQISGDNAFGWLKSESGVHRLVRISPFDSSARRHTSFASVAVTPVIDDSIEIDLVESDLRIDTYRASGAGGQHVNTTDSAVRITHLPTNIVVQCQNDRSQHRNKATAMQMLKARLYEEELRKREERAQEGSNAKSDNGWGSQIRSYVLQPYQLVKDLRTGVETGQTGAVLDGQIDLFLEASLAAKVGTTSEG